MRYAHCFCFVYASRVSKAEISKWTETFIRNPGKRSYRVRCLSKTSITCQFWGSASKQAPKKQHVTRYGCLHAARKQQTSKKQAARKRPASSKQASCQQLAKSKQRASNRQAATRQLSSSKQQASSKRAASKQCASRR